MSTKSVIYSEPGLLRQAVISAFLKLSPHIQWRNPVMFIVWVGSMITTVMAAGMLSGKLAGNGDFPAMLAGWLWLTLLFANFAEALAEGRSQAQAKALRGTRKSVTARKLAQPHYGSAAVELSAPDLRKGDVVLARAGEVIPCDGEVIEGDRKSVV